MAQTYKVLGQSYPTPGNLVDLYTVPSGTQAVCSTISICSQLGSTTYRIAVRPSGASIADQHYIAYNSSINSNDTILLTLGLSLNSTDKVSVYSAGSGLSFNLFGVEIS